jgi:hypothetical protein
MCWSRMYRIWSETYEALQELHADKTDIAASRHGIHLTFYFMMGGCGSCGHSEEVQLTTTQARQVI